MCQERQAFWKSVTGNVSKRDLCILWKMWRVRQAENVSRELRSASQEVIKKIIIWGLHNLQSKLERQTVWKHVKRALLSEEVIKKIIICLQSNLKGNKIFCWKSDSLKICQQSFAEPGSHQENYHLRLAQPAFKLKRQSLQSENVLRELCLARKSSRKLSSEACPTCNQTSKAKSPLCTAFSQVLFLQWLGYFYETNGCLCIFYVHSISNPLDRHAAPDSVNAQEPTFGE